MCPRAKVALASILLRRMTSATLQVVVMFVGGSEILLFAIVRPITLLSNIAIFFYSNRLDKQCSMSWAKLPTVTGFGTRTKRGPRDHTIDDTDPSRYSMSLRHDQ